ncbi:MAG: acyl-CoA synthetase [Clostridiales bacterium]|jgi:acetyl-CoA synthetase|nr:acyl-CoA synthetase [Clostridiales bacterium]
MGGKYEQIYSEFTWQIPANYNIGIDICDRHASADEQKLALIYEDKDGGIQNYTFCDVKLLSNKLANLLQSLGMARGDRFGIVLSQQPETVIAHVAGFKLGLINIPLFTLFGPEALEYRLGNSKTKVVIVDEENLEKILAIKPNLEALQTIICVGSPDTIGDNVLLFERELEKFSEKFEPVHTNADDPALIIYTSGTTGPPKGALHAHRVLLGHLPGVEVSHNFFPHEGDLFWTPADWAWIGGLIDVLFPSLHHGVPVVAYRAKKFDPEKILEFIARHKIKNIFMPPTALKILRSAKDIRSRHNLHIRSIASGGEPLGEEVLNWAKRELGITINEFYGQTEANMLISNCEAIMEIKPGSMGRPAPGHTLTVVDEHGNPLPAGETGEIAVKKGDPVMFLMYWQNEEATLKKFAGDWLLTGDTGHYDEDGYFWFEGRTDDVITSAGYRIGPSEIEDCLLKHPSVSLSAVVGSPDEIRGDIVKAFIILRDGYADTPETAAEIQGFVKSRLAAHEYPREIEFVKELPMTVTGKVKRGDLRKMELKRKSKTT